MSARQKIEELTNAWYGFAVFAAIVSVVQNGIGIFSLFFTVVSTVFSFVLTWFLGRRLLARSSLTRMVLLVLSTLSACFGVLAVGKLALAFFGSWSFGLLFTIVLSAGSVMMNVRSLRVLTDSSVKSYIG